MRAAVVENGVVTSVIVVKDDWEKPEFSTINWVPLKNDDLVYQGCTYDGQSFAVPAEHAALVDGSGDSPVTAPDPEPDPDTEDADDDRPIGGDPAK